MSFAFAVSGEANFTMQHTGLTIGGFTQPSVARNLLEQPINIEKGLCQRFLWLVPKPSTVAFDDLQRVNIDFMTSIGGCIMRMPSGALMHHLASVQSHRE